MVKRIGIDALFLRPGGVGGTESYLRNLLKGLEQIDKENEYYIFASSNNFDTFKFTSTNFKVINCKVDNTSKLKRVIFTSTTLPKIIKDKKIDVMFFPTYTRSVFNIKGVKIISNVHDIQYKHFPENFSIAKKSLFNVVYPISLFKSDVNICISNFVKEDIIKYFPKINKKNLVTIYNPIDFEKFEAYDVEVFKVLEKQFGISSQQYILSVASLLPHKNIATLVKAFEEYKKKSESAVKLVLVGLKEKSTNQILELVKDSNLEKDIIITGYVSDEQLAELYNNARLFISTSLFEGFGMPPVEAMYRGIPVITTQCASLPEVTLNSANYYSNPTDYNELSRVICLIDEKQKLDNKDIREKLISGYSLVNIAKKYKILFENA